MTSQEIIDAIFYLAPNSEFSFTEVDLSTLKWDSSDIARPSDEAILAAIPKVKAAQTAAKEAKASAKVALLNRLGITADEAALLLG